MDQGQMCIRDSIICYTVGIAGMIIMKLIGLHDLAGAAVYIIFLTICTAIYWQMTVSYTHLSCSIC